MSETKYWMPCFNCQAKGEMVIIDETNNTLSGFGQWITKEEALAAGAKISKDVSLCPPCKEAKKQAAQASKAR